MKILYLSGYDSAGQQFNGILLHRALRAMGHESSYAVLDQSLHEPGIYQLGTPRQRKVNEWASSLERGLSLRCVLPTLGRALFSEPYYHDSQLIHLQLLHAKQFFSLLSIPRLSRHAPVVWTMHDPWLTTGHCIHPLACQRWLTGCGKCPDLTIPVPMRRDHTALNWRIKKRVLEKSNVHLVVASEWMRDRARRSPILAHLPCTIIPFGVDRTVFRPRDKVECRRQLGIPAAARVITLRWTPYNMFKGTNYALQALETLSPGVVTHVVMLDSDNAAGAETIAGKYQCVPLGWVTDRERIIMALCASDIFVMPSIAETFGMMAVEAMACGTPVIAFEGTSLPEVIRAPESGIAVPYGDSMALMQALERVMLDGAYRTRLVANGLKLVAEEYTEEKYIQRHLELYRSILGS